MFLDLYRLLTFLSCAFHLLSDNLAVLSSLFVYACNLVYHIVSPSSEYLIPPRTVFSIVFTFYIVLTRSLSSPFRDTLIQSLPLIALPKWPIRRQEPNRQPRHLGSLFLTRPTFPSTHAELCKQYHRSIHDLHIIIHIHIEIQIQIYLLLGSVCLILF
jgi:hypothetical protein